MCYYQNLHDGYFSPNHRYLRVDDLVLAVAEVIRRDSDGLFFRPARMIHPINMAIPFIIEPCARFIDRKSMPEVFFIAVSLQFAYWVTTLATIFVGVIVKSNHVSKIHKGVLQKFMVLLGDRGRFTVPRPLFGDLFVPRLAV